MSGPLASRAWRFDKCTLQGLSGLWPACSTAGMGLFARGLGCLALVLVVPFVPLVASAQGAGPAEGTPAAPVPPPPGGGGAPAPAPAERGAGPADDTPKSTGSVGGVTFSDKPVRRAKSARAAPHRAGPRATFPGFEQLADGASRFFVHISQSVPVEERRAAGSVTYVLRGAHLRVHNDAHALVTVHFNTPVFRARLVPQGNDLLFVLDMRSASTPTFKMQEGQDKSATLQIDFPKGEFLPGDGSETTPRAEPTRPASRSHKKRGASRAAPPASADPGPTP
jgi:hypothetical protein